MLELSPAVLDASTYDAFESIRRYAAIFYSHWLMDCVESQDKSEIARILTALQGRDLATGIFDHLDRQSGTKLPPAVQKYHDQRFALRKLMVEIERCYAAISRGERFSPEQGRRSGSGETAREDELKTFTKKYSEKHRELAQLRERAAKVPGYEALGNDYSNLDLDQLQRALRPDEALLILLHIRRGEDTGLEGVLVIGAAGIAGWFPFEGLSQIALETRYFSHLLGNRGGYRKSSTTVEDSDKPDKEVVTIDTFWNRISGLMSRSFWPMLETTLDGVQHAICIPYGDLHQLPLEAGKPEGLSLSYYPGFLFFAQQRGLIAGAAPPSNQDLALGLCTHADSGKDHIPFTEVERQALATLYGNKVGPGMVHTAFDITRNYKPSAGVHFACHGGPSGHNDRSMALKLPHSDSEDENLYLDRHHIAQSPAQTANAVISACLAGQTREDLDGNPMGLVGALMAKGTRIVIASQVSIPDLWTPLLMLLTHQAYLEDRLPMDRALAEGKRRFRTGDWYPDTELLWRDAVLNTVDRNKQFIDLADRYIHIDADALEIFFSDLYKDLQPEDSRYDRIEKQKILFIEQATTLRNKEDTASIVHLIAKFVADSVAIRRVPPPLELDTLCFGFMAYGQSE